MAGFRQQYEPPGVAIVVPASPGEIADAWTAHRDRLRTWLGERPAAAWRQPTRCTDWSVSQLVGHLVSGARFLAFTLRQSKKGMATRLLEGFDPQAAPTAAAAHLSDLSPSELLDALDGVNRRVRRELEGLGPGDWLLPAEAPLGRVGAWVSVNHFLFDSWVHERDLTLPGGESPRAEPAELKVVGSYVVALAAHARAIAGEPPSAQDAIEVRMTDLDLRLRVETDDHATTVTAEGARGGAPTVSGAAADVIDFATGRASDDRLEGDPAALAVLAHLAAALA